MSVLTVLQLKLKKIPSKQTNWEVFFEYGRCFQKEFSSMYITYLSTKFLLQNEDNSASQKYYENEWELVYNVPSTGSRTETSCRTLPSP